MKKRIKIETTHEKLFKILLKTIDSKLQELGVPPNISDKETGSSYTINMELPLDGRRKLDSIKDDEGNVDLDKSTPTDRKDKHIYNSHHSRGWGSIRKRVPYSVSLLNSIHLA